MVYGVVKNKEINVDACTAISILHTILLDGFDFKYKVSIDESACLNI